MKRWMTGSLVAVMILAVASLAFAASAPAPAKTAAKPAAKPAVLEVEGKVLTVGKGWVQLQVSKILKGKGLRQGAKIKFRESAKLTVRQSGKPAALSALKSGETVDILAQIVHSGKTVAYTATSITILR